jgi:O-Antigen ligase
MGMRTTSRRVRETPTETRFRWLRVAFFIIVGAALALESESSASDPLATIGLFFHSNVSSWLDCSIKDCTLKFSNVKVIFSALEISLAVLFLLWVLMGRKSQGRKGPKYNLGTLILPLAAFAGMIVLGVLFGITKGGGDPTIALWEIRGFLMMIAMYFLAGIFLTEENHINTLIWVVFIAAGILATDNIIRWWVLYHNQTMDDLAYDHVDSVVLVFAALLCMSLLLFGGTRTQRRYAAILLPIIVIALDVMKRRAAFAILAVGLVVLVLIILRLRPRLFWTIVVPCLFVAVVYLAIFWNDTSSLGQPARAISSMFTPDPRDYSSNFYRLVEKMDILANIRTSPILGLGFGQQFIFYIPLPDLSFWPFWHYTPHNAVLWVWLKDGALGFAAFFWLLGRAIYDGTVALESQRDQWQLVAAVRRALSRRRGKAAAQGRTRPADLPLGFGVLRQRPSRSNRRGPSNGSAEPDLAWNVPSWERSEGRKSPNAAPSGVIALLTSAICLVPVQVAFSYVDLGLTSERDLLLFGLVLGILARAQVPLGAFKRARGPEDRGPRRRSKPVVVPSYLADEQAAEPMGTVSSTTSEILD